MEEYNSHKSLWNSKPLTMIRKVALVQALREAYPDRFAGTYDQSEMGEKGEAEPPAPAPARAQPASTQPASKRGYAPDLNWLKDATAELVSKGYVEAEVKAYLWSQYKTGGIDAAEEAYKGMLGAVGAPAPDQQAEPAPDEYEAVEPDAYEDEDIEF